MSDKKTAIVTGASRGIGADLVEAFLKEGYNVVATSLNVSQSLTAQTAWFSSTAISASRRPLPKLSKQRSSTAAPLMCW
jgi:NAD(P)-dependent dehydrogenase (short-subunit alcohol dehydrogenase family)